MSVIYVNAVMQIACNFFVIGACGRFLGLW